MENNELDYSLIIAIVKRGNTDLVMEASRKAGSTGGTITVARGTGNPDLSKKYGIVIQPEKEMVFIAVSNNIKDKVMKAIYDEAGLTTKGTGIVFALPITDQIGLLPAKDPSLKEEQEEVEKLLNMPEEEKKAEEATPAVKTGTVDVHPIED